MAHFNFLIPSKLEELLTDNDNYFVSSTVAVREVQNKLKEAKQSYRDDGPEFILDNFVVYYSILYHGESIPMDLLFRSYQDLHRAVIDLNKALGFLLEDKSSLNEELKQKYQNLLKMLIYVYIQTILSVEHKNLVTTKNQLVKKRKKSEMTNLTFNLEKEKILLALNNILQSEIAVFWDPPVVEENFTSLIAEVCYKFLQNPSIKGERGVREELFNLIGTLIKTYNHSTTFAIRMAQMIKDEEHLVQCLSDGVKQLVEKYNCKGLIHALVQEITEWQTDEKFQDSQGARYCAQFLSALATLIPNLMLPEVLYLNKYLYYDSPTLRNAVLNVITEVILHVLTKHSLNKEDEEYRDEFLHILFEHMSDNSAHVRTKVIQHWAKLQQENAIPRPMVNDVLRHVIKYHLHDKAALVRKSAANCVATFLSYNTYGAELSLAKMKEELDTNQALLDKLKPQIDQAKMFKSEEMEAEWKKLIPDLQKVLLNELQKEDEEDDETENELNKEDAAELIRMYLSEGRYREALKVWKQSADEYGDICDNADKENMMDAFLTNLKLIYMQGLEVLDGIRHGVSHGDFIMTEEDIKTYEILRGKVEYLSEAVEFLKLIDSAIDMMAGLLETTCISDMQEAVAFFISAYQFQIDNAEIGVMAMMQMMKRSEQDRKDMIIEAFKTVYLKTNASDMHEHAKTIVNRLIRLLSTIPSDNLSDLEQIIAEWVRKGILDNSIIDMMWQYFTKKIPVSDEYSHASVELLRMAAVARKTIITRNIKLVASIAFGEMGKKNLAFLGSACYFLAVAGKDRIDVTSSDNPFKIGPGDTIFKDLYGILWDKFFVPDEFYHHALSCALDFVYKVSGKPDEFCEKLVKEVMEKIVPNPSGESSINCFIYIRLCQLLGTIALKHLDYLDETVYRELKRRENFLSAKNKDNKKPNKKNRPKRSSVIDHSSAASTLNMDNSSANESTLEGAQAEDEDAEFILHVLERNTVTGSGLLAQLAHVIVNVCEKPDVYDDVYLQGAAITALMRYMLVSSEFCNKHVRLLFTIFERTEHFELKISILVHLSDLLTRFPNIIEPWTPRIFERLKDPSLEIRKTTFFTLSGLILRDMIRAHSNIHLMVNSLVDPDRELSSMCRMFFTNLAQKENNLYNVLPDIFSHLMESKDISDDNAKSIMKFLFELMDKPKHMENLVDRFCSKFECTEDRTHQKNIAYCLSLIVYNEKALRKLVDNFSRYKHLVHDSDVYGSFKTIMQSCSKHQVGKADLKPIVSELEKLISSVFELNGDKNNEGMGPPPLPTKFTKKRATQRKSKVGRAKRKQDSDDDED